VLIVSLTPSIRAPARRRFFDLAAVLVALVAAALPGCGVQVQNVEPARELAALQNRPPGSVYLGWRVYADKCARCHGAAATGSGNAPDLLSRMSDMGPRRFATLVLARYDLDEARASDDAAAREARIDETMQRRRGALEMPAWQGEPRVSAHVLDLYAYLVARAEGKQGPGRPTP
jgi:mono/diheme cytochrome c family protein